MRPDDGGDDAETSAGGSSARYARVCFPGVGAGHVRGHCRGAYSKPGIPLRRAASRQARPSCFQTGRAGLAADLHERSLSRAFGPRHGRGCRANSLRRRRLPVDAGRALAKRPRARACDCRGRLARDFGLSALGAGAAQGVLLPSRRAFGICLSRSPYYADAWRRGREAEGDGLLNRYRGNPIVGSNPTVSAKHRRLLSIVRYCRQFYATARYILKISDVSSTPRETSRVLPSSPETCRQCRGRTRIGGVGER